MPNWEELANSFNQPFGGVSALQGSYAGPQYNLPQVSPQMLAEMLTRQVPQEILTGPVPEMTPEMMSKMYSLVEPHLFATGGIISKVWPEVLSLIKATPRYREGGLVLIDDLKKAMPDLSKTEFDKFVTDLASEGKIALHQHDLPSSYKKEMIRLMGKDVGPGNTIIDRPYYYHAFNVKPEWR